ncbi:MAG: phage tail protein [Hyphomonadaceae bacterium]|jgi:hypothetical protein|nr:phage tail protein [Hyphomonadaceae bacterium]
MSQHTTIITDLGESLIALAAGTSSAVAITHVALGDGLGASYVPNPAQTGLRRELARRPIDTRVQIEARAWRVTCAFPPAPATPVIAVREVGFFDAQNRLICLWAGTDVTPRQTGTIEYLLDQVLDLRRVADGLVIVAAPDDELFNFALSSLADRALIHTRLNQLEPVAA